ncbi:MAG: LytR C-terminal domain-containing protein [Sphingomicrobium sp.]
MYEGLKVVMVSGCLIAAGCVTDTGKLQVRAIPDQAAKLSTGAGDVAQAKALLALGSVGLALEGFRKTLRDQPSNAEAMAGIGACYAAMGRYDLAETNYEAALAEAPQDPKLLMALADSLDAQGKNSEAGMTRADAVRITGASVPNRSQRETAAAVTKPAPATVARLVEILVQTVARTAVPSSSVTVRLPSPRPAETVRARPLKTEEVASSVQTMPIADPGAVGRPLATARVAQSTAPRLERLSPGEVALVTTARPIWLAELLSRRRPNATVRWVPIQSAAVARTGIQVLNAARAGGLASRARSVLFDRGWRGIRIGDAPHARASSIVYYPAERRALGRSLAAQFGIHMLLAREAGGVVVLLGRDAAGLKAAQRRG